ncbi:nitrogenase component 1 [Sporomusa acidovorans]|uniref:Light-independent protochlorophyllide reductase subunit B n=1 Tax=Sporomusa acidovorans (strain ATCC 49682 / DSM 3132 / Mol) TaxID=1123286 RepID=A0ABZ3IYR4_SPOA4|nr:nitrogenase component 1 [Sporomusa acidovorans]OZC16870.1 nitrogenase molybdenum-iron protein alpha chain [Sporomusa acidovorans DSM 3132]SDF24776.1 methyltransferase, MtaA/CmuA family [Sporomusa acidovorans]
MPGSNVQEREVVFGGIERLEEEVRNTFEVMQGDLYVVLTSCVTEVIGDDVGSVVRPLQEEGVPIFFAETGGFRGNSYQGYDLVLQSLFKDFVRRTNEKQPLAVNLWGITPFIDVFWRGNIAEIRRLLEKLGVTVNSFFTVDDSVDKIREAGSAALNIVVSEVVGQGAAQVAEEVHGTPYLSTTLPVGPAATGAFLREVGKALNLDPALVETVIQDETKRYYHLLEPLADCFNDKDLQRYAVIIGDTNYAVNLTRFLADDLGWLPEVVGITDILDEEQQAHIAGRLNKLASGLTPEVIFHTDGSVIAAAVRAHWRKQQPPTGKYTNPLNPAFVIGLLAHIFGGKIKFRPQGNIDVIAPAFDRIAEVDRIDVSQIDKHEWIHALRLIISQVNKQIGQDFLVGTSSWGPFTLAGQFYGVEKLMSGLYKDKAGVHALLEVMTEVCLAYLVPAIQSGASILSIAEPTASGDLISYTHFEEFVAPYIRKANEKLKEKGAYTTLHICGNIRDRVHLAPQLRVDLLSVDYKVDLSRAQQELSGKIALAGNVNPVLLKDGTVEDVVQTAKESMRQAGHGANYVLMPGCDIPPAVPLANVEAFLQVARENTVKAS